MSAVFKQSKPARVLLLLCALLSLAGAATQTSAQVKNVRAAAIFDVLHYDAEVEPDIANKTVKGKVLVRFVARAKDVNAIELDCGGLEIDAVRERGAAQKFERHERRLRIELSRPLKSDEKREVEIEYHGAPRFGLRFFPEREQVYTVFSTSQWMPCVDAPEDRATLRLRLILPAALRVVANGRAVAQHNLPHQKIAHEWLEQRPVSTYTYGFAAGRFRLLTERRGRVELHYLSEQFTDAELKRIFRDTSDMIGFYEERAGVPFHDSVYTQVLAAGGVEQEMTGFTALRESYGREVLANERDVWLGAHELAHQWWGNMLTCRDWTHFWLNEGMATFMAAAYKEHRFGRAEYMREIEGARKNYEKVRDAGKDRSLVFPDWTNPTREDRTLVYDKGAYVLHLLREELGERAFWSGIRSYTRAYFGKSVTTPDFQRVMEESSGRKLTAFFDRWVYLKP